jgi:hypothetical protein
VRIAARSDRFPLRRIERVTGAGFGFVAFFEGIKEVPANVQPIVCRLWICVKISEAVAVRASAMLGVAERQASRKADGRKVVFDEVVLPFAKRDAERLWPNQHAHPRWRIEGMFTP